MKEDLLDRTVNLNVEYKVGTTAFVTLSDPETKDDLVKNLVADGLLMCERKGNRRTQALMTKYQEAQENAKKAHAGMWEYGDCTEDDAKEFGARK